jgi:CRP-like cAMP-binding protein
MSTTPPGGCYEPEDTERAAAGGEFLPDAKPVTADQLGEVGFFRGIGRAHLEQIARYSKRSHFEPGQVIFRQGDVANSFYVIRQGRALIECRAGGRTVPVQEIGPGEPLGFSWFFDPENRHFSARAIEPVEAIFFYGSLLREECEIDHELGYELMQRTSEVMLQRLEALSALLSQVLAGKPAAPPR